jgi:methylglutaconyl-CoA hydratase
MRVRAAEEGAIGRITLARPEKRNALDEATANELYAAIKRFDSATAVRVIVIDADGEDFCAGADLAALERMLGAGRDVHKADAHALGRVFVALRRAMKPTVAAVQGNALAGGAGLANACDLVLAHESARFGYPEVRIGFVPAMVMTMLRRSVGEKRAADLVLTGRTFDAAEAERIGLVSRVFAADAFRAGVSDTVNGLARSPEMALALTKRLLYHLDDLDFAGGIAAGVTTNVEARSTDDFRRGVQHFLRRES